MTGLATATLPEAHRMLCAKFRELLPDRSRWNDAYIDAVATTTVDEMLKAGFVFAPVSQELT